MAVPVRPATISAVSAGAISRTPAATTIRPIVSANMDTITRSAMAIAVAEEGGIGIIDRGFRSGEIGPQVREVEIVKRQQHGIITDPAIHDRVRGEVHDALTSAGCEVLGWIDSPITGATGNREFLMHLTRKAPAPPQTPGATTLE